MIFKWILMPCIILVILLPTALSHMNMKEYFCGKKLVTEIANLCRKLPTPDTTGPGRLRREIVDECCEKPCSRKYLLDNYCLIPNMDYINNISKKLTIEISTESIINKHLDNHKETLANLASHNFSNKDQTFIPTNNVLNEKSRDDMLQVRFKIIRNHHKKFRRIHKRRRHSRRIKRNIIVLVSWPHNGTAHRKKDLHNLINLILACFGRKIKSLQGVI